MSDNFLDPRYLITAPELASRLEKHPGKSIRGQL